MSLRRVVPVRGNVAVAGALALAALAALAGCGQSSVDVPLTVLGSAPIDSLSSTSASVGVGTIVGFSAPPQDSSGKSVSATVTVSVDDPTVAQALPTPWPNEFILIGEAPGTTTLHVLAGGHEADTVSVTVFAQLQE
jgi:hypothetical protein